MRDSCYSCCASGATRWIGEQRFTNDARALGERTPDGSLAEPFDLIVTDVRMPGASGLDAFTNYVAQVALRR